MPSLRGLISALTQAGGGVLLFCSGHTGFALYRGVCAFPVYTAQALGCSIWSRPCVECSSSFRVLHQSANSVAPAFCVFPGLSGSGSQRLGRTLPGCSAPFPSAASSPGSQRLGCSFPRCSAPFPSAAPACAGRVPATCVCSEESASSRDPPCGGCRPSRISVILYR